MKKLKLAISLLATGLLLLFISSCGNTKMDNEYTFEEEPPFVISNAHYQKWVAGVQAGGSGTNINITFQELPDNVVIDNIFFGGKAVKAMHTPEFRDQYTSKGNHYRGYIKNDANRDVNMNDEAWKEAINVPPLVNPFELEDNQAVISYHLKDKRKVHYYKIAKVAEKPMIAYPSAKPNGNK